MTEPMTAPKCEGRRREILGVIYYPATGKPYHPLCWQKECNDYYFDQILDGCEADEDQ